MKTGILLLSDNNDELLEVLQTLKSAGLASLVSNGAEITDKAAGKNGAAKVRQAADDHDSMFDDDLDDEPKTSKKDYTKEDVRQILSQVKDTLGTENVKEIFTAFGASNFKELDAEDFNAVYAAAVEMLRSDDDLDDGLDDDLDDDLDDVPGPDVIKSLCQAYAKQEGKAKATKVLEDAGLNTVRGLAKASEEQLTKIYATVKVMEK